ncbi:MAG: hypothetical protein J2P34_08940 [Actinobacteria bacterium]|nr:hypothetical protein [Actinomycetota bacterium]
MAVLAVLALAVAAGIVFAVSPTWRRRLPRVTGAAAGGLLAAYLVVRGIVEFFIVDYANPASYRESWGGPSLAGVLAVHSVPGLALLAAAGGYLLHRRRARRYAASQNAPTGTKSSDCLAGTHRCP